MPLSHRCGPERREGLLCSDSSSECLIPRFAGVKRSANDFTLYSPGFVLYLFDNG
jgi:hypothetical protein